MDFFDELCAEIESKRAELNKARKLIEQMDRKGFDWDEARKDETQQWHIRKLMGPMFEKPGQP